MDSATYLARRTIERMYKGLCTIKEFVEVTDKVTGETRIEEVEVITDLPCKLSKKAINPTNQTDVSGVIAYAPLLFIAPEIRLKPGSKVIITQNGITRGYERSGEPFVYETHQEIILQRIDTA